MSFALCFWILMLLWLVAGFAFLGWRTPQVIGGNLLIFILLVLLGWKVFGAPLHS